MVEQLTLNQWVLGSSPRWCTKKSRNECCGFFVAPFPPGRTHTSRKRSCSSRGDWSLNSVRRTEFLTRPLMVHQSTRCKKLQRVFYCNLSKKVQSGAPSGDENSSGPPPVRRAKTPQWGVFRARESPRWCTRKSRNECCGFFVAPFPSGRTRTSRKRSCSSRGDWSLKMAAGLWAGATIERERKRGANNVRRARRTTARAVLRSKMEALQADKRTGLNS